jgi:hypothetical protein
VEALPGERNSIAFFKQGKITPSFIKSNTRNRKAKNKA